MIEVITVLFCLLKLTYFTVIMESIFTMASTKPIQATVEY